MKPRVWGESELIELRRKGQRPADVVLLGIGVRRLYAVAGDLITLSVDREFRVDAHDWWYLTGCRLVICGYREDAMALATAAAHFKPMNTVDFEGIWLVDEGDLHTLIYRKGGGFVTRCQMEQWWPLMDWQQRILKRQPEGAQQNEWTEPDPRQHRLAAVPRSEGNPQGHPG